VSYRHKGQQWCTELHAESFEDAEERVRALGSWGRVDGEIMARIPAGAELLARIVAGLGNLFRKSA